MQYFVLDDHDRTVIKNNVSNESYRCASEEDARKLVLLLSDALADIHHYKTSRDSWKRTAGEELGKCVLYETKYTLIKEHINALMQEDMYDCEWVLSLVLERMEEIDKNLARFEERDL